MPAMADRHASDANVGPHGSADDHGDTHGHDDHAHETTALGPIDTGAWIAGLGGIVLGFLVAVALALASGSITI
jgi:hypothetical protein